MRFVNKIVFFYPQNTLGTCLFNVPNEYVGESIHSTYVYVCMYMNIYFIDD